MMKQKLVALLLVSVIVASAFGAISFGATKVDALVGTTLSLSASTTTPLSGVSYTLSSSLTDGTGTALANKPIDIWVRHDGDNGILWKTMTTDSNGKYSTAATSTQKAYIRTVFNGDSAYAGSRSDLVTVTPRTLTLTASTTTPQSGQSYALSGSLSDTTGKALANKPIDIWYRYQGETTGHFWKTMYTGANGKYSTTAVSTQIVYLRTVFMGDSVYARAYSNLVTVTPTTPTPWIPYKTLTWDKSSFNFGNALVIDNINNVIFQQSFDLKSGILKTTATAGMPSRDQYGTDMALLGVNWNLKSAEWENLKDRPLLVTATVSYTLTGDGTLGSKYGSSSSTVLLGAGSDPTKPIKTFEIVSATAQVATPNKVSGQATGYMLTTLNQLKTADGTGFIWVALQTHMHGGVEGTTLASGDVTVQSIQLEWM